MAKKHWFGVLSAFMCVIVLAACGKTNPSSSEPSAVQESTLQASALPGSDIKCVNENYTYGSGNSTGYYYLIQDESANYILHYIDYATLKDIVLCSAPNCSHDSDTCSARFAYCGTPANVSVTENAVYLLFSGSPWTQSAYETYGKEALPHLVKCNLDGSDRKTISEFEADCTISSIPAIDGAKMYIIITSYADASGTGVQKLVSIDLESGAQSDLNLTLNSESETQTYAGTQLSPESRIVGACGRKIVIQALAGVDTSSYITYNVDTQEVEKLYNDSQVVSCVCKDDSCYLLEEATGVIREINIDSGEETEIPTDLLKDRTLTWITLAYVTDRGYVIQAKEDSETSNFLIDHSGNVLKQSIRIQSPDPQDKKRQLQIFDQWNGFYLVSPSRDFISMLVPGENNTFYNLNEVKYAFALIAQDDFWNDTEVYENIVGI